MPGNSQLKPTQYGLFTDPTNESGMMSKKTKQIAEQVDSDILKEKDMIYGILDEERENMQDLPEMSVDEWNKVYIEVSDELYEQIAKQLIRERKEDP